MVKLSSAITPRNILTHEITNKEMLSESGFARHLRIVGKNATISAIVMIKTDRNGVSVIYQTHIAISDMLKKI